MTGIFKQKNPGNIIVLSILGVLLKLPSFFKSPGYIIKESDGDLFVFLVHYIKTHTNNSTFAFAFLAYAINLAIALVLSNFINADRLMNKPNFLTGMAYLLITSFLPAFNQLSSNLMASMLLLISFKQLYQSYNTKNNIFNAAVIIGFASFVFVPAILFVIWAFLALATLRPFRLSEWIVVIIGLATPYYFFAAYLFLADKMQIPDYFYPISILSSGIKYSIWHAMALFFLLAPLLAGIYYVQANSGKMMIHVRKGWFLFLWYFVIAVVISLFNIEKTSENIVLSLVPIAAFHGYGYLNAELKLFPKLAFWLMVAFIISVQLFSAVWN